MSLERQRQLADEYQAALKTMEDSAVARIREIMGRALANTERRVLNLLQRFSEQPDYDPATTPGAFLGSIPEGVSRTGQQRIDPTRKNEAALYLQGQLLQELRFVLGMSGPTLLQGQRLEAVLTELFDGAQAEATRYAYQLVREGLEPLTTVAVEQFPGEEPEVAMEQLRVQQRGQYQEGQAITQLLDLSGALAAAERDFESLADNYGAQAAAATSERVRASKAAMETWWRRHGESVIFAVGTEMATGPDPRKLKTELAKQFGGSEEAKRAAVPYATIGKSIRRLNAAFHARMETIARTETLIASGEAMDRAWDGLEVPNSFGGPTFRIGFVQYVATQDDRTCEWCVPRHGAIYRRGDVKTPIHPNCVLGDTQILPGQLVSATRSSYSGNIVTVTTSTGHRLACTENHLVLSDRGWIPARLLRQGMKVVGQAAEVRATGGVPHLDQQPALIKDVFDSLAAASPVPATRVPPTPMDFHGDGARLQGEIEVVWAQWELMHRLEAYASQGIGHLDLQMADAQLLLKPSLGPLDLRLFALHAAASGLVGRGELAAALLSGHLPPLQQLGFLAAAWSDPRFDEPPPDGCSADLQLFRQLLLARPLGVALDEVVDVQVEAKHDVLVFDVSTASGAYVAGGLVTHNCRCALVPVTLEGLAIENQIRNRGEPTWQERAAAEREAMVAKLLAANPKARLRPMGMQGQPREQKDLPLMERTQLPARVGASNWPAAAPVWAVDDKGPRWNPAMPGAVEYARQEQLIAELV